MKNSAVNVFENVPVGTEEPALVAQYLDAHDFATGTRRLIMLDVRQFAKWFTASNQEPFIVGRITMRDVIDYRSHLQQQKMQAVATINRSLALLRRFFAWLAEEGKIEANPGKKVKELRRVQLAPKGLAQAEVRRLLRELELRNDIRASAMFHLLLYTGCRLGDLVNLKLNDVIIGERSGSVTFRFGKFRKERSVPLPLPARRALQSYLEVRPPVQNAHLFIGERGELTEKGIRSLCDKYSAICGIKIHPHLLRHTFAHKFLEDTNNDLVSLAQILGHENIATTAIYTRRTLQQLDTGSDKVNY